MELNEHYDSLWFESLEKFNQNIFKIDPLIESKTDLRRGITLLTRPDESVKELISGLMNELKEVEPNQYYYPQSDIHITIMSIISCYQGFDLNNIDVSKYIEQIEHCIKKGAKNTITFRGITASDSCIMLKGFPINDSINEIRNSLRLNFNNIGLEHSMDKRYKITTAHSTIVRFKSKINNVKKIIEVLHKYRDFNFGSFKVKKLQLVYNDWYQKEKFTQLLHEFELD